MLDERVGNIMSRSPISKNNSQLVKQAQKYLNEKGHKVSIGQIYDLFSKLSGFNSWKVASASGIDFTEEAKPQSETNLHFKPDLLIEMKSNHLGVSDSGVDDPGITIDPPYGNPVIIEPPYQKLEGKLGSSWTEEAVIRAAQHYKNNLK